MISPPKPHPLKALLRQRLPKRPAVTSACGLKFSEGVLICADTEMSYGGELKAQGIKIFPYEFDSNGGSRAIFAYSGATHYAKMLIQQCEYVLQRQLPDKMTRQGMLDTIKDELCKFHHEHIYKHPQYQMIGGPDFWLVVALWSPTDGLGVYESSDDAIVEVTDSDMYAAIGAGAMLARYLLHSLMMHAYLKVADIATVATFVLAEVKAWIQGCGGGSELVILKNDGELSGIGWFDISHIDPFSEVFQQSMKQLFLRACDLEAPDGEITEHIQMLATQIDGLRNRFRTESEKNSGARALMKALTTRKVTKH